VDLPEVLVATAHSDDGVLQGVRHTQFPIEAVQFHPESIMTIQGKALLANFLAA
jgi:anthranilate/para-aminobenzoate synthase component II